jgi:hypothetical protein
MFEEPCLSPNKYWRLLLPSSNSYKLSVVMVKSTSSFRLYAIVIHIHWVSLLSFPGLPLPNISGSFPEGQQKLTRISGMWALYPSSAVLLWQVPWSAPPAIASLLPPDTETRWCGSCLPLWPSLGCLCYIQNTVGCFCKMRMMSLTIFSYTWAFSACDIFVFFSS